MASRFAQLGLVLAKRRIAIHWTRAAPLKEETWLKDLREWAVAEERRLKMVRLDKKAERELEAWSEMVEKAMTGNILDVGDSGQRSRESEVNLGGTIDALQTGI